MTPDETFRPLYLAHIEIIKAMKVAMAAPNPMAPIYSIEEEE